MQNEHTDSKSMGAEMTNSNQASVNRFTVVAHLLSASIGEQRFERIVSAGTDAEAEAVDAALKCAKELLLHGEPLTMWVTTDNRLSSSPPASRKD